MLGISLWGGEKRKGQRMCWLLCWQGVCPHTGPRIKHAGSAQGSLGSRFPACSCVMCIVARGPISCSDMQIILCQRSCKSIETEALPNPRNRHFCATSPSIYESAQALHALYPFRDDRLIQCIPSFLLEPLSSTLDENWASRCCIALLSGCLLLCFVAVLSHLTC